ncbi:hypothetical protein N7488_008016 [Penicillium malachiteum]|nr:hypothetical protein N7488_008016 [Penicillium malachiteum]
MVDSVSSEKEDYTYNLTIPKDCISEIGNQREAYVVVAAIAKVRRGELAGRRLSCKVQIRKEKFEEKSRTRLCG